MSQVARWFLDYREMSAQPEIDMVVLGLPNDLHCDAVLAAAEAGRLQLDFHQPEGSRPTAKQSVVLPAGESRCPVINRLRIS